MLRRTRALARYAVIACVFTAGCGEAESRAPARIVLGETTFDAGHVSQGAKIEHEFVLRNAGERDLRITRVRSSCDCTAAADSPVAPGATAEIHASLETEGLFGDVTRTVVVFTNDPSTPAVLLKLKADVGFDVAANPRRFYVGRVAPGEDVRVQGRIMLGGGTRVAALESTGAVVTARLVEPAAGSVAADERRFQIHVRDGAPAGPFSEEVVVRTNSSATPALAVPVSGVVEGKS
jgi:hypothetical protein